jgi:putative ABC transport system substrate-binding protein
MGGTAAWPLVARAQQPERVRRIGVLLPFTADDAEGQARLMAFAQGLQQLGWTVGNNLRIDARWGAGDYDRFRRFAVELVTLAPDAIVATGPDLRALQEATRSVPIVFANATDPVGQGFVASLARPGGNITGFMQKEFGQSGKWLELLKEIAPGVKRAAVLLNRGFAHAVAELGAIQAVAPSFGVEVTPIDTREVSAIEPAVATFARTSNAGLILTSPGSGARRELIISLAARHRLPAVFPFPYHVSSGGLISYGPNVVDQYRRAAGYVDRILRGEKPADLPVQTPMKYELVINLKTAKTIGLTIPPTLLARADEVIE